MLHKKIKPLSHLLFGEDDPAVQEGRDDVVDDEMDLGLGDLFQVLVKVEPGDGPGGEHPVLLPHLVVLVPLCLLGRHPTNFLLLHRLLFLTRVLSTETKP